MKIQTQNVIKLICLIVLMSAFKANAQSTNFSGTWQIDTTRTNFNGAPPYILPHTLKVSQTHAGIIIDRGSINGQGQEKHYNEQIASDGKSSQTTTASGNTEIDSLSWSADKTSLVLGISAKSPDGNPILSATETWTLADNGKTLIIDRHVEQTGGMKYDIKAYYIKQ